MHSTTNLFQTSLEDDAHSTTVQMARSINEADLDGLAVVEELGLERWLLKSVTLQRAAAEFRVDEVSKGIEATITVPFTGKPAALQHRPRSVDGRRLDLYATVDTPISGRWQLGADKTPSTVAFTRIFDETTSVDEVKAWAKERVDLLEQVLGEQRVQMEEHNASIGTQYEKLVERRRAQLSKAAELRDGLGKGI